uniref:Patronin n=1 Tax=Meloidogyne incognita TaxID=6306 RepID=A0A914N374_MELIC
MGENTNNINSDKAMSTSNYNFEDARLQASIRWLITRIYNDQNQLPDSLCEPFRLISEDRIELTQPVIFCLTNGSFYGQAAAKIFHDPSFLNGDLGLLFHALMQAGIDVKDKDGQSVTIELLRSQSPFNTNSHLVFIDSLMVAHLRSIISIDRVVQAISNYTVIEKREEPLDCVDALLFWINKVCLIVRDDVERNCVALTNGRNESDEPSINGTTIPEMEDLYEDLCDGTCICTLVSFYRPDELPLKEVCFKDPMSVNDCKFNLELLRNFCATNLPWNPFHFRIDDILFLHESLQPNVNAFLADLFMFFEGQQVVDSEPVPIQQTVQRNFLRTQPLPDQQADAGMMEKIQSARDLNNDKRRNRAFSAATDDVFFPGTGSLPRTRNMSIASPRQTRLEQNFPFQTSTGGSSTLHRFPVSSNQDRGFSLQLEPLRNQLPGYQQQQQNFGQFQGFQRANTLNRPSKDEDQTPRPSSVLIQSQPQFNLGSHNTLVDQLSNQFNNNLKFSSPPGQRQQFPLQFSQQPPRQQANVFGVNAFPTFQSTPQQNFPNKQFASLQQQDISPIGPPPPDSIVYSDYSFAEQPNTSMLQQNIQGQQMPQTIQHMQGNVNPQLFPEQQLFQQQHFPSACPQSNYISSTNSSNLYSTPMQTFNSGYCGQQQQPSVYYTPTSYNQNQNIEYMGGGGQLQQSLSQPSHLHLLHQQNQLPQLSHSIHSQFGQKPSFQYQNQQNQPYNNQIMPQQQYTPIPSLPFNHPGGSTVFPVSADPFSLTHLQNYQQQMQQCNSNQHKPNEQNNIPFRLQQANIQDADIEPDPENDLRQELANWGKTYRLTEKPQRKTWASKKVEMQQRIIASNPVAALNAALHGSRSATALASQGKDQNDSSSTPKNGSNGASTLSSDERTVNQNISLSLDVSDSDSTEMTPEMLAKRQALLISQLKRKERIVAKSEEKELASLEKRQSEMQKLELAEQRRIEREQRRLKCLEDYKRRKLEQELGEQPGGSARMCSSSTMSLNNRGQSQPPFRRPKSQTNLNINQTRTLQRPFRAQSSVNNGGVNDENAGISGSRSNVPASVLGEPSLKLYARQQPKSNRTLILNALQYSIFPGHVSNESRQKVQNAIASSDSKHFLVLFRDHRLQYRGLYTWDQFSEAVHKIEGSGPKVCREPMMTIMYKYDSGAKSFGKIPTKHLSATIDGFVIAEQYWQRPKIPFSGR